MAIFSGEFTNDDFVFHWDNNNRISDFDSILLQLYGFQLVYNGNFINQLDPAPASSIFGRNSNTVAFMIQFKIASSKYLDTSQMLRPKQEHEKSFRNLVVKYRNVSSSTI